VTVPVLTFFNNKGGVGKTSLAYHLAWMLSEMGHKVLACDLDPQANLSSAFLDEEKLDLLWNDNGSISSSGTTIFKCVEPLLGVGDFRPPVLQQINSSLSLIPGDLALSGFEDSLSAEWPNALGSTNLFRPFRILTSFWTIMQNGAAEIDATIILADVGPNLGAINRSALIATDFVVVPLGADLFSLQGLRNLGPTLRRWRTDWGRRQENLSPPDFELPQGRMAPLGYILQQHGVRLDRPVKAYDKWANRMPAQYAASLLGSLNGPFPSSPANDPNCIATIKHYRSLVPMAQESRKPIFKLSSADGAIGSHAAAVIDARKDFQRLAWLIATKVGL
jgi:chromosome partitioning protein